MPLLCSANRTRRAKNPRPAPANGAAIPKGEKTVLACGYKFRYPMTRSGIVIMLFHPNEGQAFREERGNLHPTRIRLLNTVLRPPEPDFAGCAGESPLNRAA